MICPKRTEARDRRRTAIHEAGHLAVAQHLGVPTKDARIWRRDAVEALIETTWGGNIAIGCYGAPIGVRRVVAVAGTIAEAVWTGEDEVDFDDPGAMSATDWKQAGVQPGDGDRLLEAAEVAFALLSGPLWPALVREARRLILEARHAATPEYAEAA